MALTATVYNFKINLALIDRGISETLNLHVAQHPSETLDYLLTRVLAYCIEYTEGIEFTKGLQDSEVPAIWVHDLTGKLTCWIEVGAPSAERLHKAAKSVDRVVIYTHKEPKLVLQEFAGKRIQHADKILVHAIDRQFLAELGDLTAKRNTLELSLSEGYLYVTMADKCLSSRLDTYLVTEE